VIRGFLNTYLRNAASGLFLGFISGSVPFDYFRFFRLSGVCLSRTQLGVGAFTYTDVARNFKTQDWGASNAKISRTRLVST
jgi:hypothetical protein